MSSHCIAAQDHCPTPLQHTFSPHHHPPFALPPRIPSDLVPDPDLMFRSGALLAAVSLLPSILEYGLTALEVQNLLVQQNSWASEDALLLPATLLPGVTLAFRAIWFGATAAMLFVIVGLHGVAGGPDNTGSDRPMRHGTIGPHTGDSTQPRSEAARWCGGCACPCVPQNLACGVRRIVQSRVPRSNSDPAYKYDAGSRSGSVCVVVGEDCSPGKCSMLRSAAWLLVGLGALLGVMNVVTFTQGQRIRGSLAGVALEGL